MEQLDELPKYWFLYRNKDNFRIINDYMNKYHNTVGYYLSKGEVSNNKTIIEASTEITFEQFEKWVLNKNKNYELW